MWEKKYVLTPRFQKKAESVYKQLGHHIVHMLHVDAYKDVCGLYVDLTHAICKRYLNHLTSMLNLLRFESFRLSDRIKDIEKGKM